MPVSAKEQDMDPREKLRLLRKSADYTQEHIAHALSINRKPVSQKRVCKIENLNSHVYQYEVAVWCEALHITVTELHSHSIGQLVDLMLERKNKRH